MREGSCPGLGCQTRVNCVRALCLHCISLFASLFVTLDSCHPSHNLVMKHIPGADPELVLLNHYYEELDVSELLKHTDVYCNFNTSLVLMISCRFSLVRYNG